VGYYRGDGGNYYRGDYYRGDPFIGALVGAGLKIGGRIARGLRAARRVAGPIVRDAAPGTVGGTIGYELGRRAAEGGRDVIGKDKAPRRYRRMNPLNPRALKRALRRSEGFEKFAARTVNALYRVIDGRKVRTFKKRTPSS